MRLALVVVALALIAAVIGCGSSDQNEVIGRGPVGLVFTGDGTEPTFVKVSWQDETGAWTARDFTVEPAGQVELRVDERLRYYISLDPMTVGGAARQASPQNAVIDATTSDAR